MQGEKIREYALELANRSGVAMLSTNGDDGYPNIKAMFKMENEALKTVWFSTNSSSERVAQLLGNSKTCVYFADMDQGEGLMLVGNTEVLQDDESKRRIWREGAERYYGSGVTDPDYTVLRFVAKWGNYYHGLINTTFQIEG